MVLRITSGIYKNRKLVTLPGKDFRPLSDRVKLALFSIISERVGNSSFLDLFAGAGSVGLEALSRGAASVVFVEKERKKVELIRKNTETLGAEKDVIIHKKDVFNYFPEEKFDIVFAGPPYRENYCTDILRHVLEAGLMERSSLLILQHHFKEKPDFAGFEILDSRKYGITQIDFAKLIS